MLRFALRVVAFSLAIEVLMGAGQAAGKKGCANPHTSLDRGRVLDGRKYLETFVGDWEVEKTFYPKNR